MTVQGKTLIFGTHPTKYGFTTETALCAIVNTLADFEDYIEVCRDRLRREGFVITREVQG